MSINDDFYSNFPSLNSNSKENQRYKRISREYENYLKNVSPKSPPKTKSQQRKLRSRMPSEESSPTSSMSPNSRMDIIFSAEDRNRFEDEQVKNRQKLYQEILQRQIEEQKIKKQKEIERQKREEMLLEQRLQRQLENIKLHRDPPQSEKIVERISLSENEKDSYTKHPTTISTSSSNNDVYRYFSKSAKPDFDLYNYRKYFTDIIHDRRHEDPNVHYLPATKPIKNNELALRKSDAKKKSEIDTCPTCTPPACSRCHRKLEIYCRDCTEHAEKPSPEHTKRLEIEYNEPELPFGNQQVVIYRAADQTAPYSFNIEAESVFGKDKLEEIQRETERKLANYLKFYGTLRRKEIEKPGNEAGKFSEKMENLPDDTEKLQKGTEKSLEDTKRLLKDTEMILKDTEKPFKSTEKPSISTEKIQKEIEKPLKKVESELVYTGTIPKWKPLIQNSPPKNLTFTPDTENSQFDEALKNAQNTVITQIGFAKRQLELEKVQSKEALKPTVTI